MLTWIHIASMIASVGGIYAGYKWGVSEGKKVGADIVAKYNTVKSEIEKYVVTPLETDAKALAAKIKSML